MTYITILLTIFIIGLVVIYSITDIYMRNYLFKLWFRLKNFRKNWYKENQRNKRINGIK